MLAETEAAPEGAAAYPGIVDVVFQMAFCMITTAIVTGAVAGRMKFGAVCAFLTVWTIVVYPPLAHMVWGGQGSLVGDVIGALDFAGGDVVHISSGLTGLVLCLIAGKRRGFGLVSYRPHNVPYVALGATLLWFGWFGFNAGSEFAADGVAALALVNTVAASGAALVSWMLVERMRMGKPTLVGAATGLVAGLVVITPAAGFVEPWAAIVMGLMVSPVCYLAISFCKRKFGYDDALDAFGCHCVGGVVGGILTGLFCVPELSWTDFGGLLYTGDPSLLASQVLGILVTVAFVGVRRRDPGLRRQGVLQRQPACERGRRGTGLGRCGARRKRLSGLPWFGLGTRSRRARILADAGGEDVRWQKGIRHEEDNRDRPPRKAGAAQGGAVRRPGVGMTISQVQGCGSQHGWKEYYRGTEVLLNMVPKIKFEIVVDDERVDALVDLVSTVARTGEVGDGKIFIFPVEQVIRIRTGERGTHAV